MIIHMIRIAGNADGTDHAGAAQPDRETAACGVLVRVELAVREGLACVLQLCEKPQRGRFHQVNRVALAREPQFAVRLCALTEAAEHDQTVHRNLNRNRLLLCVFMQLEADFQRIFARKMLKLKLLLLLCTHGDHRFVILHTVPAFRDFAAFAAVTFSISVFPPADKEVFSWLN